MKINIDTDNKKVMLSGVVDSIVLLEILSQIYESTDEQYVVETYSEIFDSNKILYPTGGTTGTTQVYNFPPQTTSTT